VSPWLILALLAATVTGVFLSRCYFTPATRRHAPVPRFVEALDKFEAICIFEDLPTVHVRFRLGGAMCLECRNASPLRLTTTTTRGNS
jgi:hypothetical protein